MKEKEIEKVVLKNDTKTTFTHDKYTLKPGETLSIPEDIASIWLQAEGINKYIDPGITERAEAKAKEEIKKLEDELNKAKAEIETLKGENQKLTEAEAKAKEEIKKLKEAVKKSEN